jgi:hypothetical protein
MLIKFLSENIKGRDFFEGQDEDRRVILKWVLKKWGGRAWIGLSRLMIVTSGGIW